MFRYGHVISGRGPALRTPRLSPVPLERRSGYQLRLSLPKLVSQESVTPDWDRMGNLRNLGSFGGARLGWDDARGLGGERAAR